MKRIGDFAKTILSRVPQHAKILEVGCGEGQLTRVLRDAGCEVTALDPEQRAPFAVIAVRFEEFEAPAQSFDCIAAQLVLHHAQDLSAFLDKAQRLLNGNGIAAIDDYGWERPCDEVGDAWRKDRRDLHTSSTMLAALRKRFAQLHYTDHAYFEDGAGNDRLAFTFIGSNHVMLAKQHDSGRA